MAGFIEITDYEVHEIPAGARVQNRSDKTIFITSGTSEPTDERQYQTLAPEQVEPPTGSGNPIYVKKPFNNDCTHSLLVTWYE